MSQPECVLVRFSLETIPADHLDKLIKEAFGGGHKDPHDVEIPELPGITMGNCRWYSFEGERLRAGLIWLSNQIASFAVLQPGGELPKYFAFIQEKQ